MRKDACNGRAYDVAREVERAEIVSLGGGEPVVSDEKGDQRRVAESSQADADEEGAEAAQRGAEM
jgi:hypothetical protein